MTPQGWAEAVGATDADAPRTKRATNCRHCGMTLGPGIYPNDAQDECLESYDGSNGSFSLGSCVYRAMIQAAYTYGVVAGEWPADYVCMYISDDRYIDRT